MIRKLAPILNGVDLSRVEIGDEFIVGEAVAAMLLNEGWAVLTDPPEITPSIPRADNQNEDEQT